jgi:quinone-modifying oxidoreductase subunit QmoB
MEERKYAAYLCKGCGIGEVINFADLSKVATREAKLQNVKENDVLCSPEGLEMIKQDIANEGVNCILVAACSPRVRIKFPASPPISNRKIQTGSR